MALVELISGINWISITLFIAGLGFLIWELSSPGFGLFGVFGILCFVACIFVTADTMAEGIILTAFFAVLILILFGIFMVLMSKGKLPGKIVLHDSESKEAGYGGTGNFEDFLGKKAVITTQCRPVGNADFGGEKLEVVSRGEFIEKGETVEVVEVEGNRVVVKVI